LINRQKRPGQKSDIQAATDMQGAKRTLFPRLHRTRSDVMKPGEACENDGL
jgi:hypothetical protein